MNIKYMVLLSKGKKEREENVSFMKWEIPELEVTRCSINEVFVAHLACFDLDPEYDGCVILEDDVQLCKNFKRRIEAVIAKHPYDVISMFESACSKGELHSEYRSGNRFQWCQCNYYPREIAKILCDLSYIKPFLKWFEKRNEPWGYPIDTYISYVLGRNKIRYWMEVPFLVQHLSMSSNFVGRSTHRQSKYFIDDLEESTNEQQNTDIRLHC